jgi:hypothetical protein
MWERLTDGSASSSSLPTPTSRDWKDGDPTEAVPTNGLLGRVIPRMLHTPTTGDTTPNYDHRASPGYTRDKPVPNLAAQIEDELLPTPISGKGGYPKDGTPGGNALVRQVDALLPTPGAWLGRRPENSTADSERAASRNHEGTRGKRSVELPDVLASLGDPTTPRSDDGNEP